MNVCIKPYSVERFAVQVPYNINIITSFKKINNYKWHTDKKVWSFYNNQHNLDQVLAILYNNGIWDKNENEGIKLINNLNKTNYEILEKIRNEISREIRVRSYSRKTKQIYIKYNEDFINFLNKEPDQVIQIDIKNYLDHLADNNVTASTLNCAMNALRFYYGQILNKNFIYSVKRAKKDKKLPVVLNVNEVKLLIDSYKNIKHRLMITLIYSAGLRLSEAVNMQLKDIDRDRKLIHIRCSKGKKDRYTILSDSLIPLLNNYIKAYKPVKWLFEGQSGNTKISNRTIQAVFAQGIQRTKISKNATVHSLRHSFATHLLESGTDIRYIQELLGHESSKTTEIYTHVAQKDIKKIISPLDRIGL